MSAAVEHEPVIGLEVHVQLATASKLFCSCSTGSFGEAANSFVCPVCTGQPGVLPVLNRRAVELAFAAGIALECSLNERSVFSRKNYFYPDLPKGYQISQFDEPVAERGALELAGGRRVGVRRIHLEEDAGKLLHAVGSKELRHSLVDFNRAGIPLAEIVSEAAILSPDEAFEYLGALKAIMRYCGVSRCDMEKGELRCDANVSVRPKGGPLGVKVEIKNLNSFKAVRDALAYEVRRQREALAEGGRVVQETRLWDAAGGRTEPMRSKEEAQDYRYFPEPDLVPVEAGKDWIARIRETLPELPAERRARFSSEYGLSSYDAKVLTADKELADFFEAAARAAGPGEAKSVANWIGSELLAKMNESGLDVGRVPVTPERLAGLLGLVREGVISGKIAKEVFAKMWETSRTATELVEELGLRQVSDESQVGAWLDEAIRENPKAVEDLKAGKKKAAGALVGSVMRKSKGKADPALVNRLIKEKLQ